MKITVKKITDWDLVYEMALYTQGKGGCYGFFNKKV